MSLTRLIFYPYPQSLFSFLRRYNRSCFIASCDNCLFLLSTKLYSPTNGINLFSIRSLNCLIHISVILICRTNKLLRCLFSGRVLIRFPISRIVFYSLSFNKHTLLSCVASINFFAALVSSATMNVKMNRYISLLKCAHTYMPPILCHENSTAHFETLHYQDGIQTMHYSLHFIPLRLLLPQEADPSPLATYQRDAKWLLHRLLDVIEESKGQWFDLQAAVGPSLAGLAGN